MTNESLQKATLPEPLATKLGISPVYAPWSEPLADVILALGVNLEPFSAFAEFVAETKSKYTGFDIAGNPKPYVPLSELKKYWTVHRISKVLYAFSERLDLSADLIKRAYLGIFSTLVYTHHDDLQLLARLFFRLNLDDDRLPLRRRPSEWPDEPLHRDFFSRFAENQWLFFPLPFDADKLYDRDIDDRCILPITFGDQIAHGSAVSIYRFDIHPEYNRIGLVGFPFARGLLVCSIWVLIARCRPLRIKPSALFHKHLSSKSITTKNMRTSTRTSAVRYNASAPPHRRTWSSSMGHSGNSARTV